MYVLVPPVEHGEQFWLIEAPGVDGLAVVTVSTRLRSAEKIARDILMKLNEGE